MKAVFTLLFVSLFSTAALAMNEGRLTITFSGLNNVVVQVDNRYYALNGNTVCIDHIPAGRHVIRVLQPRNGSNVRGSSIMNTTVMVRPFTHVDVMINRFGRAYIDERRMNSVQYNNFNMWGNGDCMDNQDGDENEWNSLPSWPGAGWGNGWGNGGGNWGNNDNWGNNNNGNWGNNNNNNNNNNNGNWGNGMVMNPSNFTALLNQLRNETMDNTRMTLLRNAIETNRVNTQQSRQLMQLFDFDNDRVEAAKLLYPRCIDRNNFFQVLDAIEFSASKEALSNWLRQQR